ncbi:hypothetical protein ACIHAA_22470 [Streptomyces sp. NPDC052040]|uniref:hypothetical protein n=1 Tax=Streptomyces sp. NPDC052040 TaxID=3365682 RepID=UPI0037D02B70
MASLIISIIALCIGVANLTWQLALYLLNGPRVRVHLAVGALGRGGMVTTPVKTVKDLNETFAAFGAQGFERPVLVVKVVNHGRLAVQLLDFGIEAPKGVSAKPLSDAITETPMPYVLEPHREGTWAMPFEYAADLTRACRAVWPGEVHPLRAYVHRAGGKKICSVESLPLDLRDAA